MAIPFREPSSCPATTGSSWSIGIAAAGHCVLAQSRIENQNDDQNGTSPQTCCPSWEQAVRRRHRPDSIKRDSASEKLAGEVKPNVRYSLRRRFDGRPLEKIGDVLQATSIVGHGVVDRISTTPFPKTMKTSPC